MSPLKIAVELGQAGRFGEASRLLRDLPVSAQQAYLLGLCELNLGNWSSAASSFRTCLELKPRHPGASLNLANLLVSEERFREAIAFLAPALPLSSGVDRVGSLCALAYCHQKVGDLELALKYSSTALKLAPDNPKVLNTSGLVREHCGDLREAAALFRSALDRSPVLDAAKNNLARVLLKLGDFSSSLAILQSIDLEGCSDVDTLVVASKTLQSLGHEAQSAHLLEQAALLSPNGWAVRASIFAFHLQKRDWDAAYKERSTLRGMPSFDPYQQAEAMLVLSIACCDWKELPSLLHHLESKIRSETTDLNALTASYLFDDPELVSSIAMRSVQPLLREVAPSVGDAAASKGRPRIGYISGDFRVHAIGFLTQGLFPSHDRTKFEVFGFYSGPAADSDPLFLKIGESFDHFFDISKADSQTAFELIRSCSIDLLIDLSGHTSYNRLDVLARKPAMHTATYLGFPGTCGLRNVDFLLADRFVIPEGDEVLYSERKIIFLSPCYQVNNGQQPPPRARSRVDLGLPQDKFVFCCFNGPQKINATRFNTWMEILGRCPESILWVYAPTEISKKNLALEAEVRGVNSDRIFFADHADHGAHLDRLTAADLFLDTFPYTAHTTASDSIWAGLPVLTRAGRSFHSRVCGSLLNSVGLNDLVVRDEEQFIRVACDLYADHSKLDALKDHLRSGRHNFDLFNSRNISKQIEDLVESVIR